MMFTTEVKILLRRTIIMSGADSVTTLEFRQQGTKLIGLAAHSSIPRLSGARYKVLTLAQRAS